MRGFGITRCSFAALAALLNGLFAFFLAADIRMFTFERGVQPYFAHIPVAYLLFGTSTLAVLMIALTALVEACTRQEPCWATQVRIELSWIASVGFLQYSAALFFTPLFLFALDCDQATTRGSSLGACKRLNTLVLLGAWTVPFTTLLYLGWFVHVARQASRDDPNVWQTPVRAVQRGETTDLESDAKSIASFANYESNTTIRPRISRPKFVRDSRARSMASFYSSASLPQAPPSIVQRLQATNDTAAPPRSTPPVASQLGKVRYFQATRLERVPEGSRPTN